MKLQPWILLLIVAANGFPMGEESRKKRRPGCANYKSQENRPTRHRGSLEFVIPEDQDGWEIKLTFNKPCKQLQIPTAVAKKIKGQKGRVWTLTNKDYNKDLRKGDKFTIRDIICEYKNAKNKKQWRKVVKAEMMEGMDICENDIKITTTIEPTEQTHITSTAPTVTTPGEGTCGASVETGHSWNQGLDGKLYISFPVSVTEWTVKITLDRKIDKLDVHQGDVKTEDGINFLVVNKDYNGKNEAGSTLDITWQAQFGNGVGAPEVVAVTLLDVDCGIETTTEHVSTSSSPSSTSTEHVSKSPSSSSTPSVSITTPSTVFTSSPKPTSSKKPSNCQGHVKYKENSWKEGLDGNLAITFGTDVTEWSFEVIFDKPIKSLNVHEGEVTTEDGITFIVKNKKYNGQQKAGTKLDLGWQALFDTTDQKPQILSVCGSEISGTTAIPVSTTKPSTTSQPTVSTPETTTPKDVSKSTTAGSSSTPSQSTIEPVPTSTESSTVSGSTTETCESNMKYDYDKVLELSNLFYQAQRSGDLDALHDFNHTMIPYRGNSAMKDGSDNNVELSGGYYDAGDYVKFNFPMAAATTLLAWGAESYKKGYEAANQYEETLNTVRWATDYFIKCHTKSNELWAQVGNGEEDHKQWDRVEDMTIPRPSYKIDSSNPGSDLAGETAAALAAASIIFKEEDRDYSKELLTHARQLLDFAYAQPRGKYSDSVSDASKFYRSWSGYEDELAWAAAWLYKATGEANYLKMAEDNYKDKNANEFAWDDKTAGVQIILAQETGKAKYVNQVKKFCDDMVDKKQKTGKGLVFIQQWGPLRHASNVAFICLQAAQIPELSSNAKKYQNFAEKQINYALGDTGRSFVIGFGKNYPQKPHHRSSSCPKDTSQPCTQDALKSADPNPNILWGALVGGPGLDDSYADNREDYIKNEVACDYNAGFQSAVAGLRTLAEEGSLSGIGCGGSTDASTGGGEVTTPSSVTSGPAVSGGQDKVTAYGDAWQGNNCGFTKMPSPNAEKYFVAMPNDYYDAGATCGVCVKLSTKEKSLIVYGMNRCPECHYNPDQESHWDLSNSAYRFLIGEPLGIGHHISHEIVPCPENMVSGNMQIFTKDGSNPWWNAFQPVNFRIRVNGMSLSTDNGASWTELRGPGEHHVDGFYFLNDSIKPLSGSFVLRVNSDSGDIDVKMEGVQAMSFVDTGSQN